MVQLSDKWQAWLKRKVEAGEFPSEQVAVETALAGQFGDAVVDYPTTAELAEVVAKPQASFDRGEWLDGPEAMRKLRAEFEQKYGKRPV